MDSVLTDILSEFDSCVHLLKKIEDKQEHIKILRKSMDKTDCINNRVKDLIDDTIFHTSFDVKVVKDYIRECISIVYDLEHDLEELRKEKEV